MQAAVASVFGSVESAFSKAQDTENARIAFLSVMHNLPVQAEELTKLTPEKLAVLAYDVSEGRDKRRLDRSGGMRDMAPEWHTILTSSSNTPIVEKLLDIGAVAESFRVLEMRMYLPAGARMQDGDRMKREMLHHCGSAGHVIAQFLVDHRDVIREAIERVKEEVQTALSASTDERIRVNMVAATTVMASVLNKSLALGVNVAGIRAFGIELISMERKHTQTFKLDPNDVLRTFINENIDHCIQVNRDNVISLLVQKRPPYTMRFEQAKWRLYVDGQLFRRFVLECKMDWSETQTALKEHGLLLGTRLVTLTRGVAGVPPQGQTRCLEINARKLDIDWKDDEKEEAA